MVLWAFSGWEPIRVSETDVCTSTTPLTTKFQLLTLIILTTWRGCDLAVLIRKSRSGWLSHFFLLQIIWTSALSVHDAIPLAPYYLNWSYTGVTLKDNTNRENCILTEKKIVNKASLAVFTKWKHVMGSKLKRQRCRSWQTRWRLMPLMASFSRSLPPTVGDPAPGWVTQRPKYMLALSQHI